MHLSPLGLSKKSIIILKSLIFSALILSSLISSAQVSKSELNKLQKEATFKIITIDVSRVNGPEQARQLKANLELLKDVRDCEVDLQNNVCKIIAGFGVQKSDVLGITGRAGVKTSNYSEEIRWRTNRATGKTIQSTDEKVKAKEVYTLREADERINQPESKKQTEEEIAKRVLLDQKQNQKTIPMVQSNLPEGYPIYKKTDDKIADDQNYAAAKKEWIKNNPEKYKQMLERGDNQVKEIYREELEKMPVEKQNRIRNNPSKYKIIE